MAQLIGLARLGRDAELRTTQSGDAVASLSLAMDYRAGREKATQWVDGALWGKMAETLTQYLVKGKLVCVTLDDVHIEEYPKRDGGTGTKLVGRVSKLELAGGREDGGQQPASPARQPAASTQATRQADAGRWAGAGRAASSGFDDMDDDIPF